jgi:ABC-type uncharacterized transport system permease subunit
MKREGGNALKGKKNAVLCRILPVMFHIYFQDADSNRSIAGYTFPTVPNYATLRNVHSSIWRIDGILRKDPLIRRGTPGDALTSLSL